MLLVANERTRQALPQDVCRHVIELVENGVDLSFWTPATSKPLSTSVNYVFMGRLVNWKAVDLLLLSFKQASCQASISLTIIGDGTEREMLEQMAQTLGLLGHQVEQPGKVCFIGWMSQKNCVEALRHSDVLVLPSLLECGGAVVLEAMAMEIPVIATRWGGPADYLDSSCGILIEPSSKQSFIEELTKAMVRLAHAPEERIAMGKAGRKKVIAHFDWETKVDRILDIYQQVKSKTS